MILLNFNMPLFGKFSTKKTPPRKISVSEASKEFEIDSLEDDVIKLCLGDNEFIFEDGRWVTESENIISKSSRGNLVLRKEIKVLQEENNLLRLKFDLLLDTVTEKICEINEQNDKIKDKRKNKMK